MVRKQALFTNPHRPDPPTPLQQGTIKYNLEETMSSALSTNNGKIRDKNRNEIYKVV